MSIAEAPMFNQFILIVTRSKYWLLTNTIGVFIYLYFASRIWAPYGEEGLLGGSGDPIIWGLTAFPVLAFFSIVNLVWVILILYRFRDNRDWRSLVIWFVVLIFWGCTLGYDYSRQYNGNKVIVDSGYNRSDVF